MALKSAFSYWSVLGMALQSSRWEQGMNAKLLQIAETAAKASVLQASSTEQAELAADAEEQANVDQAKAAEVQEEAQVLFEKSNADAAVAAGEELEVDEVQAAIVTEEETSAAHASTAVADEVAFESEMAEATADAAEATRMDAQAHGEALGIGACEFIPLVDVACDVIGAITAVGLEAGSAAEAATAASELAAAAASKAEEEREVTLAAEFQAKATEDAVLLIELKAQEADTEELAAAERIEAEEKFAESDALFAKAEEEEAASAVAKQAAVEDEVEAESLAADSIKNGVLSLWDAMMASLFGGLALAFFSFRITSNIVAPAARSSFVLATQWFAGSRKLPVPGRSSMWCKASYVLQHGVVFLLVSRIFANLLEELPNMSLRARGGIVLSFGSLGSLLHTTLLHVAPRLIVRSTEWRYLLVSTLEKYAVYHLLFMNEILLVWVNFGPAGLAGICQFVHWWLWPVFLVSAICHMKIVELPGLWKQQELPEVNFDCSNTVVRLSENEGNVPTESDHLLPLDNESRSKGITKPTAQIYDLARIQTQTTILRVCFEILILTLMVQLLLHCCSSVYALWPASKGLLLATRPSWLIPFSVAVALAIILSLIARLITVARA